MTATEIITHRLLDSPRRDRARAIPGPWNDEPDKIQWTDETTGLPCLIVRNGMGGLCGYVGVNPDHPWYRIGYSSPIDGVEYDYDSVEPYDWDAHPRPDSLIDVHGGLTYSDACHGDICHVTAEHDERWWFGFDCAHSFDLLPYMTQPDYPEILRRDATYKTVAYVKAECAKLATQLAAVTA